MDNLEKSRYPTAEGLEKLKVGLQSLKWSNLPYGVCLLAADTVTDRSVADLKLMAAEYKNYLKHHIARLEQVAKQVERSQRWSYLSAVFEIETSRLRDETAQMQDYLNGKSEELQNFRGYAT